MYVIEASKRFPKPLGDATSRTNAIKIVAVLGLLAATAYVAEKVTHKRGLSGARRRRRRR